MDGIIENIDIADGILLTTSEFVSQEDIEMTTTHDDLSLFQISFCIDGNMEWSYINNEVVHQFQIAAQQSQVRYGTFKECRSKISGNRKFKGIKKGAVLLTFAIVGILWGLFGGIFVLIWMLGFGVVGEVLASKSKYQNYKMLTVSFGLYSVGYYLGAIAPLYYYPAFWYGFDRPKETVDAMIAAAHSTAGLAAIPVTLIAIVIGAVIAKRMLKKHFEKAGVI